jgi:CRISPR-associated protein Cas1
MTVDAPLISVASLHALVYCERLFYLEEVERIRVADASVFAGRRLHVELAKDDEEGNWEKLTLESETLGLCGMVDVLRKRDGKLIPYEHKRGRAAGKRGAYEAWRTDRVQVAAYTLLVEEKFGPRIDEARVRYHATKVTVRVAIDEGLRAEVHAAIERARLLRESVERPPITANERLCQTCSLAPVCLPEEARLAADAEFRPIRLLPKHAERQTLHVIESRARVGRAAEELVVTMPDEPPKRFPVGEVGGVVLHGFAQISSQALRLCADEDVSVHWMTLGGGLVGSLSPSALSAQRHLRQFAALSDTRRAFELAKRLVRSKASGQLRFLLRATRESTRSERVEGILRDLRHRMRLLAGAKDAASLLGIEGSAAREYFSAMPELVAGEIDDRLRFDGRNRRPPEDRFNALLSFGYGMLYRQVLCAVIAVGLHPGFGFYHRPRSAAQPLALDLMEMFRVPIVDMAIVGAINRHTFDPDADFAVAPGRVLLNEPGRKKMIEVMERRLQDEWRHDVVGYSLSYARIIELEVRLLEKEWLGEGGLFARFRIR